MLAFMTVEQHPASDRAATAQALGRAQLPFRSPSRGITARAVAWTKSLANIYRSAGSMPMAQRSKVARTGELQSRGRLSPPVKDGKVR